MNTSSAKMLVMVGTRCACVRIIGRANFTSSIDLKTLVNELRQRGYDYFVLDLSECVLMDSTFLGVLAGFGLKMNGTKNGKNERGIELFNPSARIIDLLENLGVLHLFRVKQGPVILPGQTEPVALAPCSPTKDEVKLACLEAHQILMQINPENVSRFKDVAQFLAEDLKKL
jgi:anti-anti-sigma regulatory factor